jgi:hypothetical protein
MVLAQKSFQVFFAVECQLKQALETLLGRETEEAERIVAVGNGRAAPPLE